MNEPTEKTLRVMFDSYMGDGAADIDPQHIEGFREVYAIAIKAHLEAIQWPEKEQGLVLSRTGDVRNAAIDECRNAVEGQSRPATGEN